MAHLSSPLDLGENTTGLRRAGLFARSAHDISRPYLPLGCRTYSRGGGAGGLPESLHVVCEIDPDEPANMVVLLAFEWTQAAPQSFRLNNFASQNM